MASLKDDALRAVRSGQPGALSEALDSYLEVLVAYPVAWAKYGRSFGADEAGAGGTLGYGPIDRVISDLQDVARATVDAADPDASGALTYLPSRIASRALVEGADALLTRTMELPLWVLAPAVGLRTERGHSLAETAGVHLVELGLYVLEPRISDPTSTADSRMSAARHIRRLFVALARAEHIALGGGDFLLTRDLDQRWMEMLEAWESIGEADQGLAAVKSELDGLRSALRFGVGSWAHREVRAGRAGSWREGRDYFRSAYDMRSAAEAVTCVLDSELLHNGPWMGWTAREQGPGVHWGDSAGDFVSFFVHVAMRSVPPPGGYRLDPADWLQRERGAIDEAIATDPQADTDAAPADMEQRRESLRNAVSGAVEGLEAGRLAIVRDAALDESRLDEFLDSIHGGWSRNRLIPELFAAAEGYRTVDQAPPKDERFFGVDQWLEKEWFLDPPRVLGQHLARPIGEQLAESETRWFVAQLAPQLMAVDGESLTERLRLAIATFRSEGYEPTAILAPVDWRLFRELGLDDPSTGPSALSGAIRKEFEGTAVVSSRVMRKDALILIDLRRYGLWRQWLLDTPDGLKQTVRRYSQADADKAVEEFPTLFENEGDPPARSLLLQTKVFLIVRERFEIVAIDGSAVRQVRLESPGAQRGTAEM